jgi:hypothetical protein
MMPGFAGKRQSARSVTTRRNSPEKHGAAAAEAVREIFAQPKP